MTRRGRLPQGAPTSNAVSDLVFRSVDTKLLEWSGRQGLRYTRYVDDITISSQRPFKALTRHVIKVVNSAGFKVNDKKISYKVGPCKITGVTVTQNSLLPSAEVLRLSKDKKLSQRQRDGYVSYVTDILSRRRPRRGRQSGAPAA